MKCGRKQIVVFNASTELHSKGKRCVRRELARFHQVQTVQSYELACPIHRMNLVVLSDEQAWCCISLFHREVSQVRDGVWCLAKSGVCGDNASSAVP
jgi:hypothetical protein